MPGVLFGHPTGNPNSHHAALVYLQAGWLEAFCVPWMPTAMELKLAGMLPGLSDEAARLARRSFPPLRCAPRIEGRWSEWSRMLRRMLPETAAGRVDVSDDANDWLMRTMKRACRRATVRAVHAYEDCAASQFEETKRQGKLCIYDMPTGYYPARAALQARLLRDYRNWLPQDGIVPMPPERVERKLREMALADVVLVPSRFALRTIRDYTDKRAALCPYGVDTEFWRPGNGRRSDERLRFIYAGTCSVQKGIPVLLDAWRAAGLQEAHLELVGAWQLPTGARAQLPSHVTVRGHESTSGLRERYQAADVLVFPSFFEGYGLVILEALACGLPVITTDATGGADLLDAHTGRVLPAGDVDALAHALRWFSEHRDCLHEMKGAARRLALAHGWEPYRASLIAAVEPLLGAA